MNVNGHQGVHWNAFHIRAMTGYKQASLGERICKGPGTAAWDGAPVANPVAQNRIRVLARRQRSGSRVVRLLTAFSPRHFSFGFRESQRSMRSIVLSRMDETY